ncbi:AraC family transcriptional regulator [Tissierella sp. MSJ-40]|uniref:AraC family transcriptional regulator n=1 Tax=Tissierella simiarum TaxID=2841534 RepID=A0ABS6EA63_9FIRM|nr:AraC family transcriptional regulator [Tissierella simiarum]MBU5439431.1 AraC family transcriptional regulator [Tissierella simiarum]
MQYSLYNEKIIKQGPISFFTEMLSFQSVIREGEHFLQPNPQEGNGFVYLINPSPGLFISISDWTPYKTIWHQYQLDQRRIELYLLETGDITLVQNGIRAFTIPTGVNLYLSRPSKGRFSFGANTPIKGINILLLEDYIKERIESCFSDEDFNYIDTFSWKTFNYNTPEITLLFLQIKQKLLSFGKSRLYYESKVGELLSIITSNFLHEKEQLKIAKNCVSPKDLKGLESVRNAIDRNVINPPDTTQLCQISAMGKTKLRESFKAMYGITLGEYIRTAKMKHSLILLANKELTVQSVAAHLGYASASKFSIAFKKIYGQSPEKYRKSVILNELY